MYWGLIIKILLVHLMGVTSPGPDFFVVTKNSLNYSRSIGVWTALGVALGIGIHVIYGIGGIAILIKQNETIYSFLKYAGALYLIYLGVKSFGVVKKRKIVHKDSAIIKKMTKLDAFKNGFVTNVLNPKATMFFLSVFSVMIPQDTPLNVLLFIAIMLIINTGLWFVLVAFLFTHERIQSAFFRNEKTFNFIFGIILIGFAFKILFL